MPRNNMGDCFDNYSLPAGLALDRNEHLYQTNCTGEICYYQGGRQLTLRKHNPAFDSWHQYCDLRYDSHHHGVYMLYVDWWQDHPGV